MIYHVSVNGCDSALGTLESPFKTINRAAKVAAPGDIIQVHEGTYRECVNPINGGISNNARIIYEAAPGEYPVIKGSEIVNDWELVEGTIWKKVLPNSMFGSWNPYEQKVEGDWMQKPDTYDAHLGDVYINGVSMYEACSMEDLYTAEVRKTWFVYSLNLEPEPIPCPEQTIYRWIAQVNEDTTTIFCNFQDKDPNHELIEINVRRSCFRPEEPGLNYITVRGFEIAHAACPFNPPTAYQIGMVDPHWSKGWIIENNDLHDAKCSAISIGKEFSSGHNLSCRFMRKSSYQYQIEAVFRALQIGWNKDNIGSHIIRNNIIHDCGENGIVGHLGCVFSRIEHNHIYNIGIKHEFWGQEVAGIKLHAPIDVVIENNNIHDCTLGTWLDWQVQGTRITRNVYHNNHRDFKLEVTHGPCVIDNNIFLSNLGLDNFAQGTAYIHNFYAGIMRPVTVMDRFTPYHFPHSTQVMGYMSVYGGDDRVLNNIFLGKFSDTEDVPLRNTKNFSAYFDQFSEPGQYKELLPKGGNMCMLYKYKCTPQPVWIDGNVYSGYAKPFRAEKTFYMAEEMAASIEEKNGEWILTLKIPENIANATCQPVTTERLGMPRIVEQPYENPDGTPIDFTIDISNNYRHEQVIPGPFAKLLSGEQRIVVWKA